MSNLRAREELIELYGAKCWLEYELNKNNRLTFHHITPQRDKGSTDIENGALLSEEAHRDLHMIEKTEEYHTINKLLQLYKHTGYIEILDYCSSLLKSKSKIKKR